MDVKAASDLQKEILNLEESYFRELKDFFLKDEFLSPLLDLENWIKTKPDILGTDILIIGQQVYTKSGPLDFLAIDNNGNIVVVELKRDKLARVVLAQAIDYASDLST